jgi:predicted MFS family arabinose efflux permease
MPKGSFLIYSLLFIAVSFSLAATAAMVPSVADYFDISKQQAVRLTWLYMLPYSVVAFVWGPLSRIVTVRRLLLVATGGFSVVTLLLGLSATIQQAFVFRFIMGCFGSAFIPLAFIVVGKTVSARDKAKHLGVFFSLSSIATCCGVFMSGFMSWRIIYVIPALLSALALVLVLLYFEEFDFRREKFTISYIQTLKDKQALKLFFVIAMGSFLFHGLGQNLGVYLSERFALSQIAISTIFTVLTACAIAFRFFGGIVSSFIGNIKLTRVGFIFMSIFALMLLIAGKYYFIFFAVVFWGGGWALSHIGLSAYLTEMPDKILRDAASLNSSLRMGFGGLGAFCGGLLATSLAGFKVLFIIVFIGIFFLGFYLNRFLKEGENYG